MYCSVALECCNILQMTPNMLTDVVNTTAFKENGLELIRNTAMSQLTAMLQAQPSQPLNHSGFALSPGLTDMTLFNDLRWGNAIV